MRLKSLKVFGLTTIAAMLTFSASTFAQEIDESELNPNSVRPVRTADVMFKRTVWYRVDLREKANTPYFAQHRWISKLIIDAVKSSLLRPYKNDSLTTRMSMTEFQEKIKSRNEIVEAVEDDWGGGGGWGDSGGGGGWGDGGDDWGGGGSDAAASSEVNDELYPEDIYYMDLKVDVLFDRRRAKWIHDVQAITLVLPAENNGAKGVEDPIASFSYKELVDNLFKENRDALWYNERNLAESKNLADAFDIGLFSAKVTKFTDAKNRDIMTMYADTKGDITLIKGLEYKYKLLEYESNLWSN